MTCRGLCLHWSIIGSCGAFHGWCIFYNAYECEPPVAVSDSPQFWIGTLGSSVAINSHAIARGEGVRWGCESTVRGLVGRVGPAVTPLEPALLDHVVQSDPELFGLLEEERVVELCYEAVLQVGMDGRQMAQTATGAGGVVVAVPLGLHPGLFLGDGHVAGIVAERCKVRRTLCSSKGNHSQQRYGLQNRHLVVGR